MNDKVSIIVPTRTRRDRLRRPLSGAQYRLTSSRQLLSLPEHEILAAALPAGDFWLDGPCGLHRLLKQAAQPDRMTKSQLAVYRDSQTDGDRADATTIRSFG